MTAEPLSTLPLVKSEERAALRAAPRLLGRIVSVSGSQAVAILESQGLTDGEGARVQIGSLVKITTPQSGVVGIVSGLSSPMPGSAGEAELNLAELTLAGEIWPSEPGGRPVFRRGVSNSPAIGDQVVSASRPELESVYTQPNAQTIEVGSLFQDSGVPANFLVEELFSKHLLVVGSTGSGKSCAVKMVLQQIVTFYQNAHIVVLDVHNEYAGAFSDRAEYIRPCDLQLPFWLLNFEELCSVLTSTDGHRDAEVEILGDAILTAKRRYFGEPMNRLRRSGDNTSKVTVDTPSPFLLSSVVAYLDEQLGKLERVQSVLPYRRLRTRIETLIGDARYSFMFGTVAVEDNMADVLSRLFRMPANGKPVTVIDLAPVPSEILDVVISLIARLALDLGVWSDGAMPLHLVCEEAHRYATGEDSNRFVPTRRSLARIAKEGRKYNVSLSLVTQRPAELDTTVISQCSTIIAMRLSTDRDQDVIRANTNEGMLQLLDFLPLLGEREAIVLGQGVPMPMRIRFHELQTDRTPRRHKRGFASIWKDTCIGRQELENVIARWRSNGHQRG